MKKTFNENINSQNGFALVLTLVVMAAMTAIGLAALTNSTTDLLITRNEKEARLAFTLSEIGIDDALTRMSLPLFLPPPNETTPNPRRVGETITNKTDRQIQTLPQRAPAVDPAIPYEFTSWSPAKDSAEVVEIVGIRDSDLGGSYEVTVDYTYEADPAPASGEPYTWCSDLGDVYDGACDPDVAKRDLVLFCNAFGFIGGGALKLCDGAEPVYEVISKGITGAGTEAVIKVYVSASSLNVAPPGGSILFSERNIKLTNNATIDSLDGVGKGRVAAKNIEDPLRELDPKAVEVGNNPGCNGDTACENLSDDNPGIPEITNWQAGDFDDYVGMDYEDLKGYADYVPPTHDGNQGKHFETDELGDICNETSLDVIDHMCSNDAKLVYLDNPSATAGAFLIDGTVRGRGLMVVTGDLTISGNFIYEGFIYVLGNLRVTGNVKLWGAIMVKGRTGAAASTQSNAVYVSGSLEILGSIPIATSVANMVGISKTLRWQRQ